MKNEYAYDDTDHIHAVTSLVVTDENNNQTTNIYRYDANGNMTCRIEGGETFLQAFNAENRMSGVLLVNGDCDTLGDTLKAWQFTYDGDGVKVKQEYTDGNGTLTTYYYAGGAYEVQTDGSTETVRQYYAIAGITIGMREGSTFYYFLTDHLGSIVGITDSTGTLLSETRYLPFGEVRTDVGTVTQTDNGYTFQRNDSYIKLLDYRFRSYSPELGRFVSPDSIIPGAGNPQAWNRYSYTTNNPINYTDPSGHAMKVDDGGSYECKDKKYCSGNFQTSFQLLPVFDDFYYDNASEETFTGFSSSGDSDSFVNPITNKTKNPGTSTNLPNVMTALSVAEDVLTIYRPIYYKNNTPYDQNVTVNLHTSYDGVPRRDAKRVLTVDEITITNSSRIPQSINYLIRIWGSGQNMETLMNLAPGETTSIPLNPFELDNRGVNIIISALTGCFGPCISTKNPPVFRGFIEFNVAP